MQLRGNKLFRKRMAGVDVVRGLDVKVELNRRGVSRADNSVAGGNKVNKHARLGSAWVLHLSLLNRNQRTAEQAYTYNKQN